MAHPAVFAGTKKRIFFSICVHRYKHNRKFTTNIVSVCSIKKAFYSCEVKKCWSSRILLKWKQHTNLFPRKIPFYFIINPHNCIYESIKSPFPHVVVFFLLIVVICFVIFKVNHGYQTIEDCKVYVTYKHRHCQTAKGEQEREGGREGGDSASSAGHLLQLLNTFNNLECQPLVIGTLMVKFTIVSYRNSCFPVSNRTLEFTIFTIKCRAGRLCFEFGFKKKKKKSSLVFLKAPFSVHQGFYFFFISYSNTERIDPPWTQTH